MKAVILAAGKGSRLGEPDLPKPLTLLANGKTILDWQLEHLANYLSLDDVILVVGYRKEEIMERFPHLLFVYNPDFASENTSKSLLRALKKINEDVLWLNGDVVFFPSVIKQILQMNKTAMVVNHTTVGEEEVKYSADESGQILEVSKQVKNPKGEALGINLFRARDLAALKKNLQRCADHDYFEKAIELCIEEKMVVHSLVIPTNHCAEIDFPEDLQKVNQMLLEWS